MTGQKEVKARLLELKADRDIAYELIAIQPALTAAFNQEQALAWARGVRSLKDDKSARIALRAIESCHTRRSEQEPSETLKDLAIADVKVRRYLVENGLQRRWQVAVHNRDEAKQKDGLDPQIILGHEEAVGLFEAFIEEVNSTLEGPAIVLGEPLAYEAMQPEHFGRNQPITKADLAAIR